MFKVGEHSEYHEMKCKFETVIDHLEEPQDIRENYQEEWNLIAQSMHSLVKHYESIDHEKVAEVFNEFYEKRSVPPALITAEETAYNHIVEGKDLEESKNVAGNSIDLQDFPET